MSENSVEAVTVFDGVNLVKSVLRMMRRCDVALKPRQFGGTRWLSQSRQRASIREDTVL